MNGNPFDGSIAIWGPDLNPVGSPDIGDPNPFGSALGAGFSYSVSDPGGIAGASRAANFTFGIDGPPPAPEGGFGSRKAAPSFIGLERVDSFLITGQFVTNGTGLPAESTIISFGVGPSGQPGDPTFDQFGTFGGFFVTEAPGPLPIAGAGAAFAWSRKLRRKQKVGSGS